MLDFGIPSRGISATEHPFDFRTRQETLIAMIGTSQLLEDFEERCPSEHPGSVSITGRSFLEKDFLDFLLTELDLWEIM